MIVVALGVAGSASTWMHNVIHEVLRKKHYNVFAIQSDNFIGMDVIVDINGRPGPANNRYEYGDPGAIIIKGHNIDRNFLAFLKAANASFILTSRDPRDSVASMIERFGPSEQSWGQEITRNVSSVLTARHHSRNISLSYEDRFFEKRDTIQEIADFLQVEVNTEFVDQTLERFSSKSVRAYLASLDEKSADELAPAPGGASRDIVTHFNRNHLGDSVSGKWERVLDPRIAPVIDRCFRSIAGVTSLKRGDRIDFHEQLFTPVTGGPGVYTPARHAKMIFLMQYCWLPRGRWTVTIKGGFGTTSPLLLRINHSTDFAHDMHVTPDADGRVEASFPIDVLRFDDPMNLFVYGVDAEKLDGLRDDAIVMRAVFEERC